ncbi:hypothetical protein [Paraburkholderia sp. RL17-347-BIC-D]|uniref:hypothetical protein n=1 Tax=Paraburkholderia sp. RL17-347-BIC-D TaxID=3031632 RepID=UPI0038BBC52C
MKYLACLLFLCISLFPGRAVEATPPTVATIMVPAKSDATALNEAIHVTVDGDTAVTCDDFDLIVNNKPGLVQCTSGPNERELMFTLWRDAADVEGSNRRNWAAILGEPTWPTKEVRVIVRSAKKPLTIAFYKAATVNTTTSSTLAPAASDVSEASSASAPDVTASGGHVPSATSNASGDPAKPKVTVLTINLHVFNGLVMLGALLLGLFVVVCTIIGVQLGLGRDSGVPQMRVEELPFSLGRCQMAFWFVLTFWAFSFMYALVGQTDTLNSESLTLMGISAGTALTSIVIDQTKNEAANIEKAVGALGLTSRWHVELLYDIIHPGVRRPLTRPLRDGIRRLLLGREMREQLRRPNVTLIPGDTIISKAIFPGFDTSVPMTYQQLWDKYEALVEPVRSNGFITDLVTDASGPTVGRWQILVWTVTLGIIYVINMWEHLELPEFGDKLLMLMGISSGIYLGFKVPETQVPNAQAQTPTDAANNLPPVLKTGQGGGGGGGGAGDGGGGAGGVGDAGTGTGTGTGESTAVDPNATKTQQADPDHP